MINGFLRSGDSYLRSEKYGQTYDGWLRSGSGNDGYLRGIGSIVAVEYVVPLFPTQYNGLSYFKDSVKRLCLVLPADAPVGDQLRVQKNGVTYAVYLVPTSDPNASGIRINTNDGVKAIRLYT